MTSIPATAALQALCVTLSLGCSVTNIVERPISPQAADEVIRAAAGRAVAVETVTAHDVVVRTGRLDSMDSGSFLLYQGPDRVDRIPFASRGRVRFTNHGHGATDGLLIGAGVGAIAGILIGGVAVNLCHEFGGEGVNGSYSPSCDSSTSVLKGALGGALYGSLFGGMLGAAIGGIVGRQTTFVF